MTPSRRETLIGLGAVGAASLLMASAARGDTPVSPFAGSYSGTLEADKVRLRIELDISADLKAAATSVDQGNAIIPAQSVKIEGDRIELTFPLVGANYKATLGGAGELRGTFTQMGKAMPLTLARGAGPIPIVAPPPTAPGIEGPLTLEKLRAHRLALGTPAMGAGWRRGSGRATVLVDGLRSAQATVPVTDGDRWHLGSITKSMTGLLAARAVEAGVLSWDTSVGSVLGKQVSGIHPDFAAVTLHHLLSHRSGLPTSAAMGDYARYSNQSTPRIGQERLALAQSVLSVAPATAPGAKYVYANAGFVVAATMLEVLAGKPWEALVKDGVFEPLGLRSAGIGLPGRQGRIDQPLGHRLAVDGKRWADNSHPPAVMGPAGLAYMNIGDVLRYLAAHRDRSPRLLRPETWTALHTPPFGGFYAGGWMKLGDTYTHNGSIGTWLAEASFNPKSGVVAAFASNDTASMRSSGTVLRAAVRAAV